MDTITRFGRTIEQYYWVLSEYNMRDVADFSNYYANMKSCITICNSRGNLTDAFHLMRQAAFSLLQVASAIKLNLNARKKNLSVEFSQPRQFFFLSGNQDLSIYQFSRQLSIQSVFDRLQRVICEMNNVVP